VVAPEEGAQMTRQLDPGQLPGTPGGDGLICAECVHGGIADHWCACVADGADVQQCRGPCRQRAHEPADCPFRQAYVPLSIRWSQVRPGDVIQGKGGKLLYVTHVESPETGDWGAFPGEEPATWTLHLASEPGAIRTANPDHPVPVLVPYAERAALLTLRAGGTGPTILERPT
jgi:hypothetical protein